MHSEFEAYYDQAVEAVRGFVGLCHEVGGPELANRAMAARAGLSDARQAFYAGQSGRIPPKALESAENYSAWLAAGQPDAGQYEVLEGGHVLDRKEGLVYTFPEEGEIVLQFYKSTSLPFLLEEDEDLIVYLEEQVPFCEETDYQLYRTSQSVFHNGPISSISPGQKLKVKKIKKREASTDVSE